MTRDRYLLDTDTCVEILRGNEKVIFRRRNIQGSVAKSEITASELYFGAAKSREPQRNKSLVDDFLASVAVVPIG